MKRSAALALMAATVVGCAGHSAKPPPSRLIVLDRSIGRVSLREPRTRVERDLGRGVLVGRGSKNAYRSYARGALDIWFAGGFVFELRTTSPAFKTAEGLGVGSRYKDVAAIPGVKCFGPTDCQHGFDRVNARGTGFSFDATGHVAWIGIGYGH